MRSSIHSINPSTMHYQTPYVSIITSRPPKLSSSACPVHRSSPLSFSARLRISSSSHTPLCRGLRSHRHHCRQNGDESLTQTQKVHQHHHLAQAVRISWPAWTAFQRLSPTEWTK